MLDSLVLISVPSVGNHVRFPFGDVVKVVRANRNVEDGKVTLSLQNARGDVWTETHNYGTLVYLTSRDLT
jgi:hypothetical protein